MFRVNALQNLNFWEEMGMDLKEKPTQEQKDQCTKPLKFGIEMSYTAL